AEHFRRHHARVRQEGGGDGGYGRAELPEGLLHRAGSPARQPRQACFRQEARQAGRGVAADAAVGGGRHMSTALEELAALGTATVYEAAGRQGLIDIPLTQLVPGTRVAGSALPVLCGQDDNLMVHACIEQIKAGDVVVLTMLEPAPVALVGDLLATQMKLRGAAGLLVDASVRDVEDLVKLGLPVW